MPAASRRWMVVVGALLALLVAGAWVYAHRGYPNTVYMLRMDYIHFEEGGQIPKEATVQLWIDPVSDRMRLSGGDLLQCQGRWLFTRDWLQCLGTGPDLLPVTPEALRDNARLIAAWRRYGPSGPARILRTLADGPVGHESVGGRPALVVSLTPLERAVLVQDDYWIDAQNGDILQVVTMNAASYTDTYRVEDEATYGPNTLPATFFDPAQRPTLLGKLSAWMTGQFGAAS